MLYLRSWLSWWRYILITREFDVLIKRFRHCFVILNIKGHLILSKIRSDVIWVFFPGNSTYRRSESRKRRFDRHRWRGQRRCPPERQPARRRFGHRLKFPFSIKISFIDQNYVWRLRSRSFFLFFFLSRFKFLFVFR